MAINIETRSPGSRINIYPPRVDIPTNEHGVVLPPEVHSCLGENCRFRGEAVTCQLNRHHLHSSEPLYVKAGGKAEEFRDSSMLTVWMPECQHAEHHNTHKIDVEVPSSDVMRQCIIEERIMRKVYDHHRELKSIERNLTHPETTQRQTKGLLRRKEQLLSAKREVTSRINEIEIIPEELVTGALLIAAPNYAKSRIVMGSGFVMTGIMAKTEVAGASNFANTVNDQLAA